MRDRIISAARLGLVFALVFAGAIWSAGIASGAAGDLDTSFDTDGRLTTPMGSADDQANAVAIQSDGKIVTAGYSDSGVNNEFALARYNTDGSLDTSFDTDGKLTTAIGPADARATAVAIQSDGKIVAAGFTTFNGTTNNDFALARYNTDGSLDTSFDTDGKQTTAVGSATRRAFVTAIAIQSNGKIVAAGYAFDVDGYDFALARYHTDGSLDTAFDSDGKLTTLIDSGDEFADDTATAVAIQSDGAIVAAGYTNNGVDYDFALARYNTDGSLDTAFDTDGVLTTPIDASEDFANAVAIQSNGRIVATGYAFTGANTDFALARYNTDGSLDTAFDSDGKLTTPIGSADDTATAVAIQSNGKIVAAGSTDGGANYDFALARYNTDGSLDTSFDADGKLTTAIGSADDSATAIAIQSDGKIVAAGYTDNGVNTDFSLARYAWDSSPIISWNPAVPSARVLNRALTCNTPVATCTDSEHAWTSGAPAIAASNNGASHYLHAVWTTDAPTGDLSNALVGHTDGCATEGPGGTPYCSGVYYSRSGDAGSTWDGGAAATAPYPVSPVANHAGRAAVATSGQYVHVAYVTTTGYGDGMCAEDPRVLWVRSNTNYGASGSWLAPVQITGPLKEVDYPSVAASGASVWVIYTRADQGQIKVATSSDNAASFTTQTLGSATATYDNKVSLGSCPGAPTPAGREGFSGRASIAGSGSLVGAAWVRDATGIVRAKISTDGGASFFTGQCTASTPQGQCMMNLAPEGALGPDGQSLLSVTAAPGRLAFAWVYDTGLATPKGLYVRTYMDVGGWGPPRLVSCMQTTAPCAGAPAAALYNDGYSPSIAMYGTTGLGVSWSACPYPGPGAPCDQTAGDPGAELLWKESWNNGATWSGGQGPTGPWGSYRRLASNTGASSAVNERVSVVLDDPASASAGCAQQAGSTPVGVPVAGCKRYVLYTGHTKYTTGGWFASNAATTRLYLSIGTQG